MKRLCDISACDRPRERLFRLGASALSDNELVAMILGSGRKGVDVLTLSQRLVGVLDRTGVVPALPELTSIPGIGVAKAAAIVAGLEFARRRIRSEGHKVREPKDILPLVSHLLDRRQEVFVCISLNGAHEVIANRIVTVGLVNACQVHPREVFADPIQDRAAAVIVAHNHPSGELTPSAEDVQVTERLREAAGILGIRFLDHVVFSRKGYYSFTSGTARIHSDLPCTG